VPKFSGWLVIDPVNEDIRYVKRAPALRRSESAYPITVNSPDSQKRVFTDRPIVLTMPGYTEPEVIVGEPETVETAELEVQTQ
jgi:hypothetical protein